MYDLSPNTNIANLLELSKLRHAELMREAEVARLLRQGRRGRGLWATLGRMWKRGAHRAALPPECPEPATA